MAWSIQPISLSSHFRLPTLTHSSEPSPKPSVSMKFLCSLHLIFFSLELLWYSLSAPPFWHFNKYHLILIILYALIFFLFMKVKSYRYTIDIFCMSPSTLCGFMHRRTVTTRTEQSTFLGHVKSCFTLILIFRWKYVSNALSDSASPWY